MKVLTELVARHRAGHPVGIPSVCSAHPWVLTAALRQARATGSHALIEATANQVNQDGGYTGLRPAAFRDLVLRLADAAGLPRERVILGGDHLGPTAWQALPAAEALGRAEVMVHEYVAAGFRKIHLDCSMACGGDPTALDDALIAERAARLAVRAEAAWREGGGEPPVYVIGTEVPVPGGAAEAIAELAVTTPAAAAATVEAHRIAFAAHGLDAAFARVVGLVVQPGVEFDHHHVVDYAPARAVALRDSLAALPPLVFEAHSTDYQTPAALAALVRDHFALLKVGPALTFALREAVWALDRIEQEWRGPAAAGHVRETLLAAMQSDPRHWRKYHHGSGHALALDLEYSLSDRIRYYWPQPEVVAALARLEASFASQPPPLPLVSQYLPRAYAALRAGELALTVPDLVIHHVRGVLAEYAAACGPSTPPERPRP